MPFLDQSDGGLAEQVVRQQVDLSHGVGQPHGQLLAKEHVGCLLAGIVPAWKKTRFKFGHLHTEARVQS